MDNLQKLELIVVLCGLVMCLLNSTGNIMRFMLLLLFIIGVILQTRHVQRVLKVTDWKTRPKASSGLALSAALLPMAIWSQPINVTDQHTYQLPMFLASFAPCVLLLLGGNLLKICNQISLSTIKFLVVIGSVILCIKSSSAILNSIGVYGGCSVLSVLSMCALLSYLPRSFTIGEAMLIAQGIAVLMVKAISEFPNNSANDMNSCIQVLILGNFIAALLLKSIFQLLYQTFKKDEQETGSWMTRESCIQSLYFWAGYSVVNLCLNLPWLSILLGENNLFWGLNFVIKSDKRISLMIGWAVLTAVSLTIVLITTSSSTIVRKYFHFLAIGIFIPGIYFDVELLCLASGGFFYLFGIFEFFRTFRIQPIGYLLHHLFEVFVDDQDAGDVILTHIYLLAGLSLPMWISVSSPLKTLGSSLPLYSGVISIGVGDTAASIVGSKFGKHHWPNSKKTVEGTLAAILFQFLVCCFLQVYMGILPSLSDSWMQCLLTVILTSLLEAFTTQIDNLVLPLFMFSIFSSILR